MSHVNVFHGRKKIKTYNVDNSNLKKLIRLIRELMIIHA